MERTALDRSSKSCAVISAVFFKDEPTISINRPFISVATGSGAEKDMFPDCEAVDSRIQIQLRRMHMTIRTGLTNLSNQQISVCVRTIIAVVLFLSVAVGRVGAWGWEGHIIVARIAEQHLTAKAKAGIIQLLGPDLKISDTSVASWPDNIRGARPETGPWHYVDIPFEAASYDPSRDCSNGQCVVVQIEHFAAVLADTNATTVSRAEALRFVVHFVGDMHQPLHSTERSHDRGGNLVKITFLSGSQAGNLHSVWDSLLLRQYLGGEDVLQYADQLNSRITPQQAKDWAGGSVADWAWESHQQAVAHTYAGVPIQDTPVNLDAQYVAGNREVVETQLMRAGIRLSVLLNKAFQ